MTTCAVELREVRKVFPGGVVAVDGVSLRIEAGQVIALLGPSGCGKTTTLRLINRLEEPSSGRVLVRGQDVQSQRPEALRRSIGYVIQEAGLFPHFTVWTNVATVPRLLGWPGDKVRRRVGEVLELVGLPPAEFGQRQPDELSGGQRQRVGVARALAADPDILLMDEPFGALDPGTRATLQDEFLRLQNTLRKTVVLVTHDLAEAGRLGDDIVLLDRGQVIQQGTLRDLLVKPANERVRHFLGRQGPALALDTLRLGQIIADLPGTSGSADGNALSPDLRLGEALAELARLPAEARVGINGRVYDARSIREHILANLAPLRREESITMPT